MPAGGKLFISINKMADFKKAGHFLWCMLAMLLIYGQFNNGVNRVHS